MNLQYVYLLQEREFIKTKEPVYKIGRTKQPNATRFSQYPKESSLIFQSSCIDCESCEKLIIQFFSNKYIHRTDIGNEYFEGNYNDMILNIMKVVAINIETSIKIIDTDIETKPIIAPVITKEVLPMIYNSKYTKMNKYCCIVCNFSTTTNYCLEMHFGTRKHSLNTESPDRIEKFHCITCKKQYKGLSGLWSHKKQYNGTCVNKQISKIS